MRIGFVGLGIMGLPMTKNLLKAGHVVKGFDLNPRSVKDLVDAGGIAAVDIADACLDADVFITMVPDSPHVTQVVMGEGGLLENGASGLLYVDMSTIRPDVSREIAEACQTKGIRALDAPVSGGEKGAVEGTLSIMVGGEQADFNEVKPVFEVLGKTIALVGPHGSGQTVKAANQLIVGGIYGLVAEAIVFLEAHGVDTSVALDVLRGGLAGSRILDIKGDSMLARQFQPGFRIDLHHKDMGIITAAAREAGVPIPLGSTVAQLFATARAQGDGNLDHSALLRVIERLSGRAQ